MSSNFFDISKILKTNFYNEISRKFSGCTAAVTSCHQIRVNYTKVTYEEFITEPFGSIPWDMENIKFFVNAEGCGYPDTGVICSAFAKKYGNTSRGNHFPCYYSRTYPEIVISK